MKKIVITTIILIIIACVGIEIYHNYIEKEIPEEKQEIDVIDNQNNISYETEQIGATAGGESFWYEDVLKYNENGKYGLMGLDGKKYSEAEYDEIDALNYEKGYIILTKNEKSKVVKLLDDGIEDFTSYYDEVGILGADYDIKDDELDYLKSDSTFVVGVNNGIREKYYEIKNESIVSETESVVENIVEVEKQNMNANSVIGQITISKLETKASIYNRVTKNTLELGFASPYGPGLNNVGNTVLFVNGDILYKNNQRLENGDKIRIEGYNGEIVNYEVYDIHEIDSSDASYFTRDTEGRKEISIQTGSENPEKRLVIFAKEYK